ncbi:MAG: aldo/keto reductase, partial [Ignavibacteria bacterium]
VLHRGNDILPLIGTTSRNRLAENLKALNVKLSPDEVEQISSSFPEGAFQGERYPQQHMQLVVN